MSGALAKCLPRCFGACSQSDDRHHAFDLDTNKRVVGYCSAERCGVVPRHPAHATELPLDSQLWELIVNAQPEPLCLYASGVLALENAAARALGCEEHATLAQLFALNPALLEVALESVAITGSWRGLVQIPDPTACWPELGPRQTPEQPHTLTYGCPSTSTSSPCQDTPEDTSGSQPPISSDMLIDRRCPVSGASYSAGSQCPAGGGAAAAAAASTIGRRSRSLLLVAERLRAALHAISERIHSYSHAHAPHTTPSGTPAPAGAAQSAAASAGVSFKESVALLRHASIQRSILTAAALAAASGRRSIPGPVAAVAASAAAAALSSRPPGPARRPSTSAPFPLSHANPANPASPTRSLSPCRTEDGAHRGAELGRGPGLAASRGGLNPGDALDFLSSMDHSDPLTFNDEQLGGSQEAPHDATAPQHPVQAAASLHPIHPSGVGLLGKQASGGLLCEDATTQSLGDLSPKHQQHQHRRQHTGTVRHHSAKGAVASLATTSCSIAPALSHVDNPIGDTPLPPTDSTAPSTLRARWRLARASAPIPPPATRLYGNSNDPNGPNDLPSDPLLLLPPSCDELRTAPGTVFGLASMDGPTWVGGHDDTACVEMYYSAEANVVSGPPGGSSERKGLTWAPGDVGAVAGGRLQGTGPGNIGLEDVTGITFSTPVPHRQAAGAARAQAGGAAGAAASGRAALSSCWCAHLHTADAPATTTITTSTTATSAPPSQMQQQQRPHLHHAACPAARTNPTPTHIIACRSGPGPLVIRTLGSSGGPVPAFSSAAGSPTPRWCPGRANTHHRPSQLLDALTHSASTWGTMLDARRRDTCHVRRVSTCHVLTDTADAATSPLACHRHVAARPAAAAIASTAGAIAPCHGHTITGTCGDAMPACIGPCCYTTRSREGSSRGIAGHAADGSGARLCYSALVGRRPAHVATETQLRNHSAAGAGAEPASPSWATSEVVGAAAGSPGGLGMTACGRGSAAGAAAGLGVGAGAAAGAGAGVGVGMNGTSQSPVDCCTPAWVAGSCRAPLRSLAESLSGESDGHAAGDTGGEAAGAEGGEDGTCCSGEEGAGVAVTCAATGAGLCGCGPVGAAEPAAPNGHSCPSSIQQLASHAAAPRKQLTHKVGGGSTSSGARKNRQREHQQQWQRQRQRQSPDCNSVSTSPFTSTYGVLQSASVPHRSSVPTTSRANGHHAAVNTRHGAHTIMPRSSTTNGTCRHHHRSTSDPLLPDGASTPRNCSTTGSLCGATCTATGLVAVHSQPPPSSLVLAGAPPGAGMGVLPRVLDLATKVSSCTAAARAGPSRSSNMRLGPGTGHYPNYLNHYNHQHHGPCGASPPGDAVLGGWLEGHQDQQQQHVGCGAQLACVVQSGHGASMDGFSSASPRAAHARGCAFQGPAGLGTIQGSDSPHSSGLLASPRDDPTATATCFTSMAAEGRAEAPECCAGTLPAQATSGRETTAAHAAEDVEQQQQQPVDQHHAITTWTSSSGASKLRLAVSKLLRRRKSGAGAATSHKDAAAGATSGAAIAAAGSAAGAEGVVQKSGMGGRGRWWHRSQADQGRTAVTASVSNGPETTTCTAPTGTGLVQEGDPEAQLVGSGSRRSGSGRGGVGGHMRCRVRPVAVEGGGGGSGESESGADGEDGGTPMERWREVVISGFTHPRTKQHIVLVSQHDVSARVWAEKHLARVMEAEHALLESIFPTHVLEHIAITAASAAASGPFAECGGSCHSPQACLTPDPTDVDNAFSSNCNEDGAAHAARFGMRQSRFGVQAAAAAAAMTATASHRYPTVPPPSPAAHLPASMPLSASAIAAAVVDVSLGQDMRGTPDSDAGVQELGMTHGSVAPRPGSGEAPEPATAAVRHEPERHTNSSACAPCESDTTAAAGAISTNSSTAWSTGECVTSTDGVSPRSPVHDAADASSMRAVQQHQQPAQVQHQQHQQQRSVQGVWPPGHGPAVPLQAACRVQPDSFLPLATSHTQISVLFCDIQGFTAMSTTVPPATVMAFLNELYTRLDALLDAYGVYKVETIGDCYMAAGGLMRVDEQTGATGVLPEGEVDPLHAVRTVQFAKALLSEASHVLMPNTGQPVRLRVGIHSGSAMSGVVGTRMPRFCLFGDTINTASRMESTGAPGVIHVSQATRDLAPDEEWVATGGVEAKGKGFMHTYTLGAAAGSN